MRMKNNITKRLQETAPQPKDNETFMEDTIRQINLLPSPESELQKTLRQYTLLERLSMRIDAVRWLLLGGMSSATAGYIVLSNFESIMSALMSFLLIF